MTFLQSVKLQNPLLKNKNKTKEKRSYFVIDRDDFRVRSQRF